MGSVNRENMRLWIAALRSGRYRQGKGALKERKSALVTYCCLGVACEVAKESGHVELVEQENAAGFIFFDEGCDILPSKVATWLGVERNPSFLASNGELVHCTRANDCWGLGFEEIADGLEEYYELREGDIDASR